MKRSIDHYNKIRAHMRGAVPPLVQRAGGWALITGFARAKALAGDRSI